MMTGAFGVSTLTVWTMLAWPSALHAQETQPATPKPADNDRAIEQMVETLKSKIGASTIDPAFIDYDDVLAAEHRLDDALKAFGDAFKHHVFQQRNWEHASRDYVFCRNAASPRLTGNVIRVGPDQPFKDLPEITPAPKSGDLILLGEGVYHLFDYQQQFKYQRRRDRRSRIAAHDNRAHPGWRHQHRQTRSARRRSHRLHGGAAVGRPKGRRHALARL
jgi:hypothetical protein